MSRHLPSSFAMSMSAVCLLFHCCLTAPAALAQTYDAVKEFNKTGSQHGKVWTYGTETAVNGAFTPMAHFAKDDCASNPSTGYNCTPLNATFDSYYFDKNNQGPTIEANTSGGTITYSPAQPLVFPDNVLMLATGGSNGTPPVSVVRFTAPAAGTYNLTGAFSNLQKAHMDLYVSHNGTSIFSNTTTFNGSAAEGPVHFSKTGLTLKAGDTVDFIADDIASSQGDEVAALSATLTLSVKPSPLTLVDPYLLKIPSNDSLPVSSIVDAAAARTADAKGLMADGSSAAIAVYQTNSNKKVTFSVTNGATIAAYNPGFLTSVSGASTGPLTVTPTKIGADYYALALVSSGVAPAADYGVDTVVHAESAGSSTIASASLLTLPAPIVLIHGLWGDMSSLASTEAYLKGTPAYTANRWLITPICYSDYLGFDAAVDTLAGHGSGCEVTSAEALETYLSTTLYKQLDADHYVGGRVDTVVHSMGGLVARHFEATSGYKSIRNRMLGVFRNVITLDTPETGSALATYLDDTAYKRTFQSSSSTEFLLWTSFCGSTSTTIESCFDQNGLPLSYPGQPLSTGAVYSLIPGGRSIVSAPPADIFNTAHGKWYAIASNFKEGDQPPALLRDVLNAVTAATYSSSPPTVDSILGTPDSDVIVTLASQTSTAPEAQVKEFKDLEHTPAPSAASALFSSDSNASVVESAAVNGQVAYWLGLQKSPVPADSAAVQAIEPERAKSAISERTRPHFLAPERLSATLPELPVGLGQPLRIPLAFHGPEAVDIVIDETNPADHHDLTNFINGEPAGSSRPKVIGRVSSGATIEVTPLQTGPLNLNVSVLFADGGLAQRQYRLNVVPKASGLEQFELNRGFRVVALVMEGPEELEQTQLFPRVKYSSLAYPIYLHNLDGLAVTVDQPEDDPIVRVDPSGLVHAVRPGTATITADFEGVRDSVTIEVYAPEDAPGGYIRE